MLALALAPATCTDACTHTCSNICTSWDPPYVPQQPDSWGGLGQGTKSQGCGTSPTDGGQAAAPHPSPQCQGSCARPPPESPSTGTDPSCR